MQGAEVDVIAYAPFLRALQEVRSRRRKKRRGMLWIPLQTLDIFLSIYVFMYVSLYAYYCI